MVRMLLAISLAGVALSTQAQEEPRSWWKTPDQQAAELLESGDAARASEIFRDPSWRGISHYRNGNFAAAQKEFSAASDAKSLYNAGTAAARSGDYQAAVELLEKAAEADPTNPDAAHNLDIAKQLRDQQQSDQSQQSDGDNDGNDQQSEQQNGDQQQPGEQQSDSQQGDSQQGEQQPGEQEQEDQQGNQQSQDSDSSGENDRSGELSTSKDDAQAQQELPEPEANDQQREAEEQSEPGEQSAQTAAAESELASTRPPLSESEQATEQWMRRIPDDPSQLLRNKIKLNHMIQHENVTDLPEPW